MWQCVIFISDEGTDLDMKCVIFTKDDDHDFEIVRSHVLIRRVGFPRYQ